MLVQLMHGQLPYGYHPRVIGSRVCESKSSSAVIAGMLMKTSRRRRAPVGQILFPCTRLKRSSSFVALGLPRKSLRRLSLRNKTVPELNRFFEFLVNDTTVFLSYWVIKKKERVYNNIKKRSLLKIYVSLYV